MNRDFSTNRLFPILIVLLALAAYYPALRGGFVWDDDAYVTGNPHMRAADGLRRIWSTAENPGQNYPLVYTTFWLEYRLWGANPFGYHLLNVLFHIANALLLGLLLARLKIPGAWWAAAFFALHPVEVESVAWITELKNVQSGFFSLLTLLAYLSFEKTGRTGRYFAALAAFLLALLSKTAVCPLPFALLLLYPLLGKRTTLREIGLSAPFFGLSLLAGGFTWWYEVYHVGTRGSAYTLSFLERLLLAGRGVWFYIGKLAWPFHLTFMYPRRQPNTGQIVDYLPLLALLLLIALLWRFRASWGRFPLIALIYFIVILSPTLGFVSMYAYRYSYVADHYQYLASIGLIALAVGAAAGGFGKIESRRRVFLVPLAAAFLLCFAALTRQQAQNYRDRETLWLDTIAQNPACWMAHHNLGILLLSQKKFEEAIAHFTRVGEILPEAGPMARTHVALALKAQGRTAEAASRLRELLREEPNYVEAHVSLGVLLSEDGKNDEALLHFTRAIEIDPSSVPARINLGIVLAGRGEVEEARRHYRQALRIRPYSARAHYNLANLLLERGDLKEAAGHYREAIAIEPDSAEAHYNLGTVYLRQGKSEAAIASYEQAVELNPTLAAKFETGKTGH